MVSWRVEVSPSARASCKQGCKEKIDKGVLRWAKVSEHPDFGEMKVYFHLECLKYPKKAGFEFEEVGGLDELDGAQQEDVKKAYEAAKERASAPRAKKVKEEKSSSSSSSKKRVKDEGGDDQKKTKKRAKKRDENLDEIDEDPILMKYKKMVIADLKDYLRLNKQILSGKKEELVARCVDGEKNGRLPNCPTCGKGRLSLTERETAACGGYFDEDINMRIKCKYEAPKDQVKREKWLTPGKDDPEEETPGTGGSGSSGSASALSKADLEKVKTRIAENMPPGTGNKESAQALLKIARQMNIEMPTDETTGIQAVASVLMGHRKEDGTFDALASFLELRKKFGNSAENAKKKEKEEAAKPQAIVSANSRIADMLEELATLEARAKDTENYMFAVRSLKNATQAIRICPFEITSGAQVSKGKQKLAGVGAGTGKKIQEVIDTGSMSRLDELRERKAKEGW